MNRTMASLILVLALLAGSCTATSTEQPEPLVLPYTIYEGEYEGNQVTITLQTDCMLSYSPNDPTLYCFHIAAHIAEGQPRFGAFIITVILTEGYQPESAVDWFELIGDQKGSGGLWEREDLDASDVTSDSAYGLGATADHPAAVFVRVVAADQNDPNITMEEIHGPVAVLQILPDGQGVIRLDP